MPADVVVLDASAAVELLARTPRAASVAAHLDGARIAVPASFDVEVQSALRGLERSAVIAPHVISAAAGALARMPATRWPLPPLAGAAWSLRHRISLYDAQYVALSAALRAPLLTTDARLARAGDVGVTLLVVR